MQIFRFTKSTKGRAASVKPVVVILDSTVTESDAESIKERFPNALRIAEVCKGTAARDGYFSILRIKERELDGFDYDLKGCQAIIVEGTQLTFYSELLAYRESIAKKAKVSIERVRFCCSFLSEQGCSNFSCYSAGALRDYASEMGITGVLPTSKKEVISGNSLCLCVKSNT